MLAIAGYNIAKIEQDLLHDEKEVIMMLPC
jgi:hypothetical protein